jgi:arylsulfatase B
VPDRPHVNFSIVDLWGGPTDGPAVGLNNSWACSQTNQAAGCKYEDEIFVEEVLARIAAHDPSTPFMLFWAPHIAHAPLEVPQAYVDKFSFIDDMPRRMYAAMVNYVDGLVGRVVDALKAKGMWDSLLWMSSADNGGPIYNSGAAGANNWPLRGGKMSNWQGGIRVNAYAAGGLLPPAVRGTKSEALMAGCDVYATFCALAGVDPTDERAAAAGLPPVDGINQWPLLSGATSTPPRTEVPVGSDATEANLVWLANKTVVQALVRADGYKLIIGETGQNIWTGPQYPNKSTSWDDTPYRCGVPSTPPRGKGGCLFNIFDDPTEHNDIAADHADIVAEMYARILELQTTAFGPERGSDDGAACQAAMETWKGFWGPFIA